MEERIIEVEAKSLEEARMQVEAQIPEGFRLLSEEVISDTQQKIIRILAETTEMAFERAEREMPENASMVDKRILTTPEYKTIVIESFDEESVQSSAEFEVKNHFGDTGLLKGIELATLGSKGFLGIGKKPNQYEIKMLQQAVVEITYKTKTKIIAKLGEALKWGDEPPNLLVFLLEREPPQGRQSYIKQVISTIPKDKLPANVTVAVPRSSGAIRDKTQIQHTAVSAAKAHGFRPDIDRLIWQDVPIFSGVQGSMVAVYQKHIDFLKESYTQFDVGEHLTALWTGDKDARLQAANNFVEAGGDNAVWGHVWLVAFGPYDPDTYVSRMDAIKGAGAKASLPIAYALASPVQFLESDNLVRSGDVDKTRDLLEAMIKKQPEWGDAWKGLGILYKAHSSFLAARACWENAQEVGLKNESLESWIEQLDTPYYAGAPHYANWQGMNMLRERINYQASSKEDELQILREQFGNL